MRKPVDTLGPAQKRQAAWDAIRKVRKFETRDIWMETALGRDTVKTYITGLQKAGYIRHIGDRPTGNIKPARVFEIVPEKEVKEAPRVRKDGTEVTMGRGREFMWRTMRILKDFTPQDLAVTATTEDHQIALDEAEYYCRYLCLAGILRKTSARPVSYHFQAHRYTGPRPPQIQRVKQVWDPNTETVLWSGGDA